MVNGVNLLVVVAHPDDEVLGCAGLLLHNFCNGGKNHVLYLNNGCHYRQNFEESVISNQIYRVSEILKFTPHIETLSTGNFDTYPQRVVNDLVSKYVKLINPDVVVTHVSNDLHRDHVVVNNATMVACRFTAKNKVKSVIEMPVISSSEINPNFNFQPNMFLDITEHIETKKLAMEEYVFELESMRELRGAKGIEGWAIFYGMHIGVQYAEAYKLIRGII
jgi:LmbE family N-acetylglucosaminyl deacetylase